MPESSVCYSEMLPADQSSVVHLQAENAELRNRLQVAEFEAARYRDLADNAVEGVYRASPEGRYLYANRSLARMYGYDSPEDLITNAVTARIYLNPAQRQEQRRLLEAQGEVHGFEAQRVRKDGSVFWAAASIRAVKDQQGNLIYTEGTVVDITQRKQLLAQLEAANKDLEEARAQAFKANQAKSDFLSRMSHELRTPLNAVLGFAQLLELDRLTPDQRESVDHILKGGRHLLGLINEVLDIARIESGRMTLSLEPVLVNDSVAQTLDLAGPLAVEQKIVVSIHGPDAPAYAMADANRLRQVLLNLLANAIKYNRPGGSAVIEWTVTPEQTVRIGVRDTGRGIPAEKMARLFQPFDRLDAEQTGVEGTGLGLALSKQLVEAMHGTLGVRSVEGQGSTFWLELPLVAKVPAAEAAPEPALPSPGPLLRTIKVVYVEDNLSNLRLVERLMSRFKEVRLLSAMQGSVGLDLIRQHQPDLVFLDLNLPDISGEVVLQRLLNDPRIQNIPVVILSAEATPRHMERLLAAGARAYLTKPLDVNEFVRVFHSLTGDAP